MFLPIRARSTQVRLATNRRPGTRVGRGSLFGQVVAAAVILDPRRRIVGLDDSKKLPAERREILALRIREHALAWAIAEVDARRIDAWNIYQASRQAMSEALRQLKNISRLFCCWTPCKRGRIDRAEIADSRGCAFRFDRGRFDHRQSGTRPADARVGPNLSAIRAGAAQGLRHARPSGRLARSRSNAAASFFLLPLCGKPHAGRRAPRKWHCRFLLFETMCNAVCPGSNLFSGAFHPPLITARYAFECAALTSDFAAC